MRILIVTPAPRGSRLGNYVTAARWAGLLKSLGHDVRVAREFRGQPADLLIALHARKSASSIQKWRRGRPKSPIVLCLTGTDVYQDMPSCAEARRSVMLADRIVTLQPLAATELPEEHRRKARTILQSVPKPKRKSKQLKDAFEVCVMGHLREVKDPFRAAEAARLLPENSQIRVIHLGGALSSEMESRAIQEAMENPRYEWLGELPRPAALRTLMRCRLMVLSSLLEGGANAISEAVVLGVPVLASRIDGSVGLLGDDYPGYFEVGDTKALAALLYRAETESAFYESLQRDCARVAENFKPEVEREAWRSLIRELSRRRP